jgi:hypothetical protein
VEAYYVALFCMDLYNLHTVSSMVRFLCPHSLKVDARISNVSSLPAGIWQKTSLVPGLAFVYWANTSVGLWFLQFESLQGAINKCDTILQYVFEELSVQRCVPCSIVAVLLHERSFVKHVYQSQPTSEGPDHAADSMQLRTT